MHAEDLVFATANELAASIRTGAVRSVDVVGAQLDWIATHNPRLNAIVTVDGDRALQLAAAADRKVARGAPLGLLHGVPVTIKDSISTAGLRTTSGSVQLGEYIPAEDATVVARLKDAGAIVIGKTNLPTFGGDSQTDNPLLGRTNNPWHLGYTPGGSTGGGAAAVAAGLSPLELGSDWGGSVRVPAHFCGVYTIKPTDHRVPWTGHIPPLPGSSWGMRHLAVIGPLARSVDDLELALRIISGPDGRDWQVPPINDLPVASRPLDGLRLAWSDDFAGAPVSVETRAALAALVGRLQDRGCTVERWLAPGFDLMRAWELWGELRQSELSSALPLEAEVAEAQRFGVSLDSEVPWLRGRARALNGSARGYMAALSARAALINALEHSFASWDALLCPVAAGPAFPHCPTGTPVAIDQNLVPYWMATGMHSMPFNTTGHPAVVLPLTLSRTGLPIGVQMVGRRWGDLELLAVARQLATVIGACPRPPAADGHGIDSPTGPT
jgi:amidase